ncbi:hypothetical protein BGAL_0203g00130 [Botrytis galanthina]|uniref:Uncharacterized protein n=1 Tax=Botrytis galanthina TaxID=278940 RepID=A0A4S8R543_9HELO|nr:hypothetical protein BGAL_0203g00130 [Botrytis galanthina]
MVSIYLASYRREATQLFAKCGRYGWGWMSLNGDVNACQNPIGGLGSWSIIAIVHMKGLSTYHNPQGEPQKLQKDAKDTVGSGNNKEYLQITKESSRMPRNTVPIHCHKQALQGEYNTRTSLYGATQALASRLGNAHRLRMLVNTRIV